jgi:GTP-binding protein
MQINQAAYAGSYPQESKCPAADKPEYAFIGRSNVGKSSLINMLCGRKNIAHTSGKPGKTQMLNFYLIEDRWYLVDLPGYGYARISKKKRREWEHMIRGYLVRRQTLQCAFILVDCNVPPQQLDIDFMNKLGEERIPFAIVYTKADKVKPAQLQSNIDLIETEILKHWTELPPTFLTSSETGRGKEELLSYIHQINEQFFNFQESL